MTNNKNYSIKNYRGKPTIHVDGTPVPSYSYFHPINVSSPWADDVHKKFADHGCRFFCAAIRGGVDNDWHTTDFWTDDNEFPNITDSVEAAGIHVCRQAEMILKHAPDAYIWVRFQTSSPPKGWREKHTEECLLNSYGKRYEEPSLASESYLEQVEKYISNAVAFCERQPWADRIAGYIIYPLGEGTTVLAAQGYLFDHSEPTKAAFKQFLKDKYKNDRELQIAWNNDQVTLETAAIPTDQDFRGKGLTDYEKVNSSAISNTGNITPHRLHWPKPSEIADARDYCRMMRELTENCFRVLLGAMKSQAPNKLAALDAFKGNMLGWPLVARWLGDYQTHGGLMHAVSGAFGTAEMLESIKEIDIVATPADYLDRSMGFGFDPEGIGSPVVLRNKMMMVEEDQRTRGVPSQKTFNPLKTDKEIEAGFWRNLGAALSRGYNPYITEMSSSGSWFNDNKVQEVLSARTKIHHASIEWDRSEVPAIVMVIDDWSVLDEDLTINYLNLAVINQRLYGLARCGVPFRVHLFEDLNHENFPDCHKIFYFPNLYRADDRRLDTIRKKVFRNGNVAIFGPASGMITDEGYSSEAASKLIGMPMVLMEKESPRQITVDNFDHDVTKKLTRRLDYGDSYPYGPILVPEDTEDIISLGNIQLCGALDYPGLAIREFGKGAIGNGDDSPRGDGDYASVFSAAVPLPAELLRELARYSGTHVYGENDDLIFADSCSLTIHSVYPGRRSVKLPEKTTVWDVIANKKIGDNIDSIEFEVSPPQTNMFYLGVDNPFKSK